MSTNATIKPITTSPLSLPKIMGMGPIIMTPPVCISVFDEPEDDCKAVPMNIINIPNITTKKPAKITML